MVGTGFIADWHYNILNDIPPVSGLEDVRDTLKITFGAYHSAETDTVMDFRTL